MNSLSFYINNILNFDRINKYNENPEKKFKIDKIIISNELTTNNDKKIIQRLLILELLFVKHCFYLTIKKGNYKYLKIDIFNKNIIKIFLLKYIWIFSLKKKNLSLTNKNFNLKKKRDFKSLFFFKLKFLKELENFFNTKYINKTHLNLIIKSNNLKFLYKSLKIV